MSKFGAAAEPLNLIKLGLLDADKVASPRAIKNAQKRLSDLMKLKHYREYINKANESGFESIYVPEPVQHQIVKPEDYAGHEIVSYKTDRSDLGRVESFLGNLVDTKVQSGTKFTPKHAEQGLGWMSMGSDTGMAGIANKAHRKAITAENVSDRPSMASSILMGEESSQFSTPLSQMMIKTIKQNMPSKKSVAEFNADMRKTDQNWVGLESDSVLDQLMGKNGFDQDGAGALRNRFLDQMNLPKYRDKGFPQPGAVFPVIDNPDYQGLPLGAQGINMWLPDTARRVEAKPGLHESYSHGMPLMEGPMGRYEAPISFAAQNPSLFRELEKVAIDKHGKPLVEHTKLNKSLDSSYGVPYTRQAMDQEAIDSANKAIEHNKRLIAEYGSIPAALAAGQVFADDKPQSDNPFANLVRKYGFTRAQEMINEIKSQIDRKQQIKDDTAKMASWERESHRAPRSDALVTAGELLQADEGNIGLLDALGTSLEKIGQGMELDTTDYIFPALEVAALPAMKPSISALRSTATKAQPFRHVVDDAVMFDRYGKRMGAKGFEKGVRGSELLGSAADVGLNTAFGAATLEEILRKLAEQ